jgi:glycosyltransferase involved in cell wall biosynthesis
MRDNTLPAAATEAMPAAPGPSAAAVCSPTRYWRRGLPRDRHRCLPCASSPACTRWRPSPLTLRTASAGRRAICPAPMTCSSPHANWGVKVLQVSAAHVYLTYPFVLSWSLLEAMACGAAIVASDTAPVREVFRDGVGAALVAFIDDGAVARAVLSLLDGAMRPALAERRQAIPTALNFDRKAAVIGYDGLVRQHERATQMIPFNTAVRHH